LWQSNITKYIGAESGATDGGARFDLPPYYVCIKTTASDTELPNFECDFQKKEISFEWVGMLARFYREAAVLEKLERSIMAETAEWVHKGDCSIVDALALHEKHMKTRRSGAKEIRRKRIKELYLENHDWVFEDRSFEEEKEEKALDAIQDLKLSRHSSLLPEDEESRLMANAYCRSHSLWGTVRAIQGSSEFKGIPEEVIMAMFTRVENGRAADDVSECSDTAELAAEFYYEATDAEYWAWEAGERASQVM
jgi:hypothetical protein